MATKKENPFMIQEKRKQELAKLKEQAKTTNDSKQVEERVRINISLTKSEVTTLKKMAIDEEQTVSGLIRQWMSEHQ